MFGGGGGRADCYGNGPKFMKKNFSEIHHATYRWCFNFTTIF